MENEVLDQGVFDKQSDITYESVSRLIEGRKSWVQKKKYTTYARYALIALAVMAVFATIIEGRQTNYDRLITGLNLGFLLLYIIAYFLSFKWPRIVFIVVLVLFSGVLLLAAIGDPISIIKGILVKILIFYYLIMGVNHAKDMSSLQQELKLYGYDAK